MSPLPAGGASQLIVQVFANPPVLALPLVPLAACVTAVFELIDWVSLLVVPNPPTFGFTPIPPSAVISNPNFEKLGCSWVISTTYVSPGT